MTPLWMALVWAVHALLVMLEWCFTIDLLDSSAAGGLGSGLRADAGGVHRTVARRSRSPRRRVLALYHGLDPPPRRARRSARRC